MSCAASHQQLPEACHGWLPPLCPIIASAAIAAPTSACRHFNSTSAACITDCRLFDSDNDLNQGVFAETIRQQHLNEQMAFYQSIEDAILDQAEKSGTDACTPQMLSLAFKKVGVVLGMHGKGLRSLWILDFAHII